MDENECRFTVRLNSELKNRLDRLGEINQIPTTWFVRKFLSDGIDRFEHGEDRLMKGAETAQ